MIGSFLGTASLLYGDVNVAVSIVPQKTFVEKIGGDKVRIALMVPVGSSPHTYEPKPSQMKDLSNAQVYYTIDVEFEKAWLPRFGSQNKKMQIISLASGIKKIPMPKHHHEEAKHKHHEKENHTHNELDSHLWTSPQNVKIISKNILNSLVALDKPNEGYYKKNYDSWMAEIDQVDTQIKSNLASIKNGKFMVFHPAWGYFAKQYNLEQIGIEVDGKEPKPQQLVNLLREAKEEKVNAIFTAPEFSEKSAKQIADELKIPVVKISPLHPKWGENLINLSKTIANK